MGETRTTVRASTKDVRLLFVLGCPSRTTAEDVLLTDEFLGIKFVAKAIEKRRTRDKLAIFDAQAALIDENSLSRLNSELRESEKG